MMRTNQIFSPARASWNLDRHPCYPKQARAEHTKACIWTHRHNVETGIREILYKIRDFIWGGVLAFYKIPRKIGCNILQIEYNSRAQAAPFRLATILISS
jgi:hypothetical protein